MQTATAAESYVRLHWHAWTTQRRLLCRVVNPALSLALSAHGAPRFSCPICKYKGPFFAYASRMTRRDYAMCPGCGSFERHRLQWFVLQAIPERSRFRDMRLLHFAPEPFFSRFFRDNFKQYTTADLSPLNVDYEADITKLPFQDGLFDMVYASHVLEHVADDRRAVAEIHRVLAPGGIAVLPVPVCTGIKTVEYPEPNPYEAGHVRQPGYDYYDRYTDVFAKVVKYSSNDFSPDSQLYIHEDRTGWPTPTLPHKQPMPGTKHEDIVPVCYK